jgi:subtilisin family serine protease
MAMSKCLLLASFFLFLASVSFAQIAPSRYWVKFSDKNGSPFSINAPEAFLSQRAIQRRLNQNIAVIENDIPVNQTYIDAVAATGAQILNRSKWHNSVTILSNDSAQIDAINALPFVVNVNAVALAQQPVVDLHNKFGVLNEVLNKTEVASPSISNADYGMGLNQIDMLGGIQLHEAGFRGQGVLIAVIDAGFYNSDILTVFDSLRNENRIIATRDFVDGDLNVYGGSTHGTMVLSTMAAISPGQLIGTAPKASYLLLRSEEGATEYLIEEINWASAAEFADSAGADIINSSLGYTDFDDASQDHTYADMDGNTAPVSIAADIAASKGIAVVNSAGNEGSSPWFRISAPSDADSVLAIGAVDGFGQYVAFSGKGYSYDGRIKPNVVAQGKDAAVVSTGTGDIMTGNGTSFSGPIIAGMVACLWQANPTLTNMELLHAIEQSASQYNNPDSLMGYGIPNFSIANLILSDHMPESLDKDELLKVYPSPFDEDVTGVFYSALDQPTEMRLTAVDGRKIYYKEIFCRKSTSTIIRFPSLENLAQGVYIFSVTTPSKVYYKWVLKR